MKPIVQYKAMPNSQPKIYMSWDINDNVFWFAKLDVMDHPRLGDGQIKTSAIVGFSPVSGVIETRNTIYVPIP